MACGCKEKGKLLASFIEIFVLAIALIVVVALFSLPIIFYYISVSITFHIKLLVCTVKLTRRKTFDCTENYLKRCHAG